MEEQIPTPAPLTPQMPQAAPVSSPPAPPNGFSFPKEVPPWVIISGVVLVILVGSILFAQSRRPTVVLPPTPTPTMTPTPTPIRKQSTIATESAFLELDTAVGGLRVTIAGYNPLDQSLAPPTIDLSLGFSN